MMTQTRGAEVQRAFDRARGRAALVHDVGETPAGFVVYAVNSSRCADQAYTVTVSPTNEYRCDCPAGDLGRPTCWHRAAVYSRRATLAACRKVLDPAEREKRERQFAVFCQAFAAA